MTPSADSLLVWEGVLFVHDGPYADAIMRFSVLFERDYPRSRPVIKFGPDVYHRKQATKPTLSPGTKVIAMVDPKTLIWSPRRGLAVWQYVPIQHPQAW